MVINDNSKKTYAYNVYGLNIESDISFPQLTPINCSESNIDVSIISGKLPQAIGEQIDENINNSFELNGISFFLEGVAGFYIANGNKIVVEIAINADIEIVKNYILGYTFGILLLQRGNIAIHGGTVVIQGQGIIFTGDSGAGKSTLTTALINKEYSFMNDDISSIGIGSDNKPIVYSGYPQQKLCIDVLEKMGYRREEYKLIDDKRNKYIVPVQKNFISETMPLGAIVEITQGDNSDVIVEKIIGIEKLKIFQKNIYNIGIAKRCGINGELMKKSLELVQNVSMYRIIRPKNKFTVEEQIAKLEYVLNSL